ncbi:unnamed protein product [Hymenolepis diminuta]|uniref:Uncharacterized protein n=1 Tax=Hymenolepis diminuta TaxID=6216 RepID=A0A0R3SA72_HYMDI|nr:unnamed protein product [Hymenolepis diminuta]VUZ43618.1 unnamed protein product [Hymenolepis diminuta]
MATFGAISTINLDRRKQFEFHHFSELTNLLGTNWILTTAYHPQAFPSSFESSPYCTEALFFILLGIRIADLNDSTAEIVFRVVLQLSGQLLSSFNVSLWPNSANYAEIVRSHMHKLQTDRLYLQPYHHSH